MAQWAFFLFAYCFTFYAEFYVRPFLCKCILCFEHDPFSPTLLCLSHVFLPSGPFVPLESLLFLCHFFTCVLVCIDIKLRTPK